jgi:exopolysaccharide biosynthesis polyprenyl glycosylphosphotransferase
MKNLNITSVRTANNRRLWLFQGAFVLVNFLSFLLALNAGSALRFDKSPSDSILYLNELRFLTIAHISYSVVSLFLAVLWVALMAITGAFRYNMLNGGYKIYHKCINCTLLTLGIMAMLFYYFRIEYSRIVFVVIPLIAAVTTVLANVLLRRIFRAVRARQKGICKTAVIVGFAEDVEHLTKFIGQRHSILGYVVAGEVIIERSALSVLEQNAENIEQINALLRTTKANSLVVVGQFAGLGGQVREIRWALEGKGVELVVDSNLTIITSGRIQVSALFNLPLLHIDVWSGHGVKYLLKRLFDIGFSALILLLFAPLLLPIALIIKLQDGGPIFFTQARIGKDHKPFKIYKFRSMKVGAESALHQELEKDGQEMGALYKIANDSRITRIGHFIRKTSIDEFPQFINVLLGDMSVVGPRPQIADEIEHNSSTYNRRLKVKPGITGAWQVSGRSSLTLDQSIEIDINYIENWTLLGDLAIIFQTLSEVVHPKGAM